MADTYTLTTPIEYKGETIKTLALRPVRMKDLRTMDGMTGEIGRTLALVASITGVAIPALDEMTPDDFSGVMKALEPHMGNEARAGLAGQPVQ